LLAACPVLIGTQNWDDHDRSGRYTARDIGANYLESCAPNSILFTYGDNDSFPVWYVQDVEQVRSDVRVVNLSYIQAGWYIDMMRQKAFKSDPLPFTLTSDKYLEGDRTQLPVYKRKDLTVNIKNIIQFVGHNEKEYLTDISGRGDYVNYIPTNMISIDVDSSVVLANGTVKKYFKNRLVSPMVWEYSDEEAYKGDVAMMDLLSTNKWGRPVYISTTVPSSQYKGLENYFIQEGMAYRITPVKIDKNEMGDFGMIDPYLMYDNMMNKFKWGNADDPSVYLDENNRRMFCNFRRLFGNLGRELLQAGDTARAIEAVNKGLSLVSTDKLPNDYFSITPAEVLIWAGKKEEGEKIINDVINYSVGYLEYAISLGSNQLFGVDYYNRMNLQALYDIYNLSLSIKNASLTSTTESLINKYYEKLYSRKK
jgi:hypothetical protein